MRTALASSLNISVMDAVVSAPAMRPNVLAAHSRTGPDRVRSASLSSATRRCRARSVRPPLRSNSAVFTRIAGQALSATTSHSSARSGVPKGWRSHFRLSRPRA